MCGEDSPEKAVIFALKGALRCLKQWLLWWTHPDKENLHEVTRSDTNQEICSQQSMSHSSVTAMILWRSLTVRLIRWVFYCLFVCLFVVYYLFVCLHEIIFAVNLHLARSSEQGRKTTRWNKVYRFIHKGTIALSTNFEPIFPSKPAGWSTKVWSTYRRTSSQSSHLMWCCRDLPRLMLRCLFRTLNGCKCFFLDGNFLTANWKGENGKTSHMKDRLTVPKRSSTCVCPYDDKCPANARIFCLLLSLVILLSTPSAVFILQWTECRKKEMLLQLQHIFTRYVMKIQRQKPYEG